MSLVMMMNMDLKIQGKICLIDLERISFFLFFFSFISYSNLWSFVKFSSTKNVFSLIGSILPSPTSPLTDLFFFFFNAVIFAIISSSILLSNIHTPKVTLVCLFSLFYFWSSSVFLFLPGLSYISLFWFGFRICFSWYLKLLYLFCLSIDLLFFSFLV